MVSNEVASGSKNRDLQVNRQTMIEESNTEIIEQHFLLEVGIGVAG